jgi:hypothetical protein
MAVSLPVLSLTQQTALQASVQASCYFPVTYSVNRVAVSMIANSGYPINGIANTQEKWLSMSYTPPTACGLVAIGWQGFYFDAPAEQFIQTSLGLQISYASQFIDTTSALLAVDVGNIIYWDEFAYGFQNNYGSVNKQRYAYYQKFSPYAYFIPSDTSIYIYPYIRIPVAYHNIANVEQSVTLHLVTTTRR